jgi:hypothetical protein
MPNASDATARQTIRDPAFPRMRGPSRARHSWSVLGRRKKSEGVGSDVMFEASKVDFVSLSDDGSTVSLYIVSDSPWSGSDAQLESLQNKIHNYVSFALDGPMTATYPETQGLRRQIVIDCQAGPPDEPTDAVLTQVGQAVRGLRRGSARPVSADAAR